MVELFILLNEVYLARFHRRNVRQIICWRWTARRSPLGQPLQSRHLLRMLIETRLLGSSLKVVLVHPRL
jgi:hypothetical protein